jgi:hypothetical protein
MARRKKMVEEIGEAFQEDAKKADAVEEVEKTQDEKVEIKKEKPSHLIDGQKKLADHLGCRVDLEEVGDTYKFVCHKPQKKVVFTKWMGFNVVVK